MAWTEQCKIAFRTNAEGLIHKRGGKDVVKVLRQLSRESEIPFATLQRWYYPRKNKVKNDLEKKRAYKGIKDPVLIPLEKFSVDIDKEAKRLSNRIVRFILELEKMEVKQLDGLSSAFAFKAVKDLLISIEGLLKYYNVKQLSQQKKPAATFSGVKMDEDFKSAYDSFYEEIQRARNEYWDNTSKEVILDYLEYAKDLVEVALAPRELTGNFNNEE